ncbi:MAG: 2,3-bisphosphoglycerate-independent phosphoglycerate mutase [Dehalococcoidia bacterium]
MTQQDLIAQVAQSSPTKIILLVIDGLGGLPHPDTGKSELETAHIPNLDRLTAKGICGLTSPVAPGISPGSGPGHLALFGYDPVKNLIKRGVLEAAGIGLELGSSDLAARGNFCTVDGAGLLTDRRAGRIPTEESWLLCQELDKIGLSGAEVEVHAVKDHRFVVIFHGDGLSEAVSETDPQQENVPPLLVKSLSPEACGTAELANQFIERSRQILGHRSTANMVLLRGFSKPPKMPSMRQIYKLRPAAVASYPMYRGVARLLGMECLETGPTFEDEIDTLSRHYDDYDFFYIHFKAADTAGEDGDFDGKVRALEELDPYLPRLTGLEPEVFVVAGDHSTPAILAAHSWHPVPVLLRSRWAQPDDVAELTERACSRGVLGLFPATDVMSLVLAHALKLSKFGP